MFRPHAAVRHMSLIRRLGRGSQGEKRQTLQTATLQLPDIANRAAALLKHVNIADLQHTKIFCTVRNVEENCDEEDRLSRENEEANARYNEMLYYGLGMEEEE